MTHYYDFEEEVGGAAGCLRFVVALLQQDKDLVAMFRDKLTMIPVTGIVF